jgi:tyrosinase
MGGVLAGVTLTRYDIHDLNNGQVAAFPVEDPPGWDEVSLYYAKALQKMGWLAPGTGTGAPKPTDPSRGMPAMTQRWKYSTNPCDYFFWAGMHWWPGEDWQWWGGLIPPPLNEYWGHCTHGAAQVEQYFLPWHRIYIYFYEVIIRGHVKDLGGPDDWALPYWNYSYKNPGDPSPPWPRARLPWVFCQEKLPDGSGNPLYVDDIKFRGLQPTWPSGPQQGATMYLVNTTPPYAAAYGNAIYQDPNNESDGFNPTLDGTPHGMVHVDTGTGSQVLSNTGWMYRTQTAGFDPIFWLHHSQVDRLWVGWNALGGPNPGGGWLTAADDDPQLRPVRWNFWEDCEIDNKFVVYPGEMLDPENLAGEHFPYSYRYQDLPAEPDGQIPALLKLAEAVPTELLRAVRPSDSNALPEAAAERELASDETGLEVHHQAATTRIALPAEAPELLRAFAPEVDEEPPRVMLYLEQITGADAGNYLVYVNDTEVDRDTADQVPNFVGAFTAFGADHHEGHEGHGGMSASYDITDLVAYLRARGEWDEEHVDVTIVPAAPEGFDLVTGPVNVGRISIRTS